MTEATGDPENGWGGLRNAVFKDWEGSGGERRVWSPEKAGDDSGGC